MGKINKGILGGFRGKVGNVIGSFWKGKALMRSIPGSVHQPDTEAQLAIRQRFSLLSTFLSLFLEALKMGFKALEDGTTYFNEALKHNWDNAVSGAYPAQTIDYSKVYFSKGNLTNLGTVGVTTSGGDCDVTWQDNSGTGTADANDFVYALFYNATKDAPVFMTVGSRTDATYTYTYPVDWQTDTVHVWLFAINEKDKVSTSQYAGQFIAS